MHFPKRGPVNTAATVAAAIRAAREQGIRHIVVASSTGETAKLLTGLEGIHVTCVTHAYGSAEDGKNDMPDGMRKELTDKGVTVVTASHVLSGVERGISTRGGGMYPAEIMAQTLRMLGEGLKVCVEVSIMALDAGAVPHGEKVVVIGGTGKGADTAAIVSPAHAAKVFQTKIHEIICKPSL